MAQVGIIIPVKHRRGSRKARARRVLFGRKKNPSTFEWIVIGVAAVGAYFAYQAAVGGSLAKTGI